MLCERSDKIFNDYLDGDLTPAKMSSMELHLAECGDCRREFERLKLADDYLRRGVRRMVEEIPVPDGLLAGFEKRLAGEKSGFSFQRRVLPLARYAGIAAAFLILVAAAGMFRANLGAVGLLAGRPDARSSLPATEMTGEAPDTGQTSHGAAKKEKQIAGDSQGTGQDNRLDVSEDRSPAGRPPGEGGTEAGENLQKLPAQELSPALEPGLARKDLAAGSQFSAAGQAPAGINGQQEALPESSAPPGQGAGGEGTAAPRLMAGSPAGELDGPFHEDTALKQGSVDQAIKETGFTPALPSYMPPGTSLAVAAWGKDAIYLQYRVGQFYVTIGKQRAPEGEPGTADGSEKGGAGCSPVEVNGVRGCISETRPQPGDSAITSRVHVSWQQEGWALNVEGNLPSAEILKIANSVASGP